MREVHETVIGKTQPFALQHLDKAHLGYDLTTDLALAAGSGPSLTASRAVILPGDERWLPANLGPKLRSYVQNGGRALSLGIDSLRRRATVTTTAQSSTAQRPLGPFGADIFGARPGALVTNNRDFILVIKDGLGIFATTSGAFSHFPVFQPFGDLAPPAGPIASAAGTSNQTPSIIGFPLGHGTVVEVGLPSFGMSLAGGNTDAQELVQRLWTVLSH